MTSVKKAEPNTIIIVTVMKNTDGPLSTDKGVRKTNTSKRGKRTGARLSSKPEKSHFDGE